MTFNITFETSLGLYPKGIFEDFSKGLSSYFATRNYGRIETIYSNAICVSKDVETLFPTRPIKLYRKEPALAFDYKLSYEDFKYMSYDERKKYIAIEFLKALETALKTKNICEFNVPAFIDDVRSFVENESLS